MLNLKKRAFIENYKLTRNLTKSCLSAGYSPKNAPSYGGKLLKDPEIAQILNEWEQSEKKRIATQIEERNSLVKIDKGTYLERTFLKAETVKHPPTAAKYWELAGKAAGFIGSDGANNGNVNVFNVIAKELKLSLKNGMPQLLPEYTASESYNNNDTNNLET